MHGMTVLSATATPKSVLSEIDTPDLDSIHELLETMRLSLSTMGKSFESLGEQTAHVSKLGPAIDTTHQINQLRRELVKQGQRQDRRLRDMDTLIRDVLKAQIADHYTGIVNQMIRDGIARRVQEGVAEQLKIEVPARLKDQIDEHKKQLAEVRNSLFNAEARRANALLRSSHLHEPLRPLLTTSGEQSALFPHNLNMLFTMPSSTARLLLKEYDIQPPDAPDTRERNLNKFMSFIGVAFQMVPAPSSSVSGSSPTSSTAGYPLIAQS